MFKTIKSQLTFLRLRIRITLLKQRIKSMSSQSYLDLWDRVALKDALGKLQNIEKEARNLESPNVYSMQ